MMGNFFPPVIFQVEAVAGEAIAQFKAINTQLKAMEAQAIKTGRALSTMNKAVIVGTKALKVFGLAFAGFAAIGVKEVIELERAFTRLGQAMANAGVSSAKNREEIAKLVDSYEELGFGSEKAADAYSTLITATGDVEKSNRLLAISADLARYKQMSLDEAARTMAKATQGSARAFRELGITLDTTKSKSVAIEEAIDKLSQKVGGQAVAYSKTFAGQLAILNENLGDLAEAIGMKILPFLNRLVSGLNNSGEWIKKNNDFVVALAAAITIALIPAVVSLTKKLALLALAILRSPIGRLAVIVFGVAYAFVKAYNSSEDFRKGFASVVKAVISVAQTLVNVVENIVQAIYQIPLASQKAAIWLRKLFGKDTTEAEKGLREMEKQYAAIDKWSDKLEGAKKSIDSFSQKKLQLKWDFKIPEIPGFENGKGLGDAIAEDIAKGLDKAEQRFADFSRNIADKWKTVTSTFQTIISKDFDKLIQQRIGDPIDQLIYDAQASINKYENASRAWATANSALTKSQNDYVKALKSGDETLMAAAESALTYAENAVGNLADDMASALDEVEKLQEQMINSIAQMYEKISELETERTKTLQAAQKERTKLEKDYNDEVSRLRADYDKSVLLAEMEAAKRRAEIIKSSVDQMRSAFRSATYRTLGDVYQGLTFEGRYLKGGSMEKILKTLGLQTEKAKNLADNAAKLAGMGFSQTFIEEVIALGPDMGNSLANTILTSTPESINQLQTYWKKLEETSLHGVDGIAKQLNSGITLATEELTAQLAQVDIDLKAQLAEQQANLTESLKDAFKSYNDSLKEINDRTTEQINAIDAQIALLNSKIAMMRSALASISTLSAPGSGGTTTIIPRAETTEETGPASSCASGAGVYKVVTYDGKVMSRTLIRCVTKIEDVEPKPDESGTKDSHQAAVTYKNAAEAYAGITGATTISSINAAVNAAVATNLSASAIANAMASALLKSPDVAELGGAAGALSSARYTGQAIAQMNRGVTVNITANTNASSQEIANDVGWAIRTSGDVQYRVPRGAVDRYAE